MTYFLYQTVMSVAAPVVKVWLGVHPAHRPLLARFAPPRPAGLGPRPLWVQACSVGEVATAKPIIRAMQQRWPDVPVLLTASTESGCQLAGTACGDVPFTWFPVDHRPCVQHFIRQVQPCALVLIETEIWPNAVRETRRFGAPVILMNGRLSDKHLKRYQWFAPFLRPVVRQISVAGMQNEEYAERLRCLGCPASVVRVTGCTKFDGVATAVDPGVLDHARTENGFGPGQPVLIFGSTRPGDEALAAACWRPLRQEFPALRLAVAPRHLDRISEVLPLFHDEPVLRRSEVKEGRRPAGERVFVLDTVGELTMFYGLALVAVIGGSFYPGVNGHNPIEPAALGVPTVFGPYMRNFIDPARELRAREGARQVSRPEELLPALRRLLNDPVARRHMGDRGREAVLANQGAIARNLDLLETVLPNLR
jgi:3-deoxy-D-manno-octulosonic-acid transferase